MLDRFVEQMKEKQGVTEQLKAENQVLWVGKMNNIIACAEEIVVREVVYVWLWEAGRLGGWEAAFLLYGILLNYNENTFYEKKLHKK